MTSESVTLKSWCFHQVSRCSKTLAFRGLSRFGVVIYQPRKKPKGQELTAAEKAENQVISSIRVIVEHIISGVKRCRIVKRYLS